MESLTEETKVRAKLLNPLGVIEGMLKECKDVLSRRRKELATDAATLNLLKNRMETWERDMDHDMTLFQHDVGEVLTNEMGDP